MSKIEINWMIGWANPPILNIYEDSDEPITFTYEKRGNCYFAVDEASGHCSYYYYSEPGHGFGGRKIDLPMDDGTVASLSGPWSSRSSVMNGLGFPESVECVFIASDGARTGGAILVSKAQELMVEQDVPAHLSCGVIEPSGEYGYTIFGTKICYQCDKFTGWLAPDSRCGECTRYTPEEIKGEELAELEDEMRVQAELAEM